MPLCLNDTLSSLETTVSLYHSLYSSKHMYNRVSFASHKKCELGPSDKPGDLGCWGPCSRPEKWVFQSVLVFVRAQAKNQVGVATW